MEISLLTTSSSNAGIHGLASLTSANGLSMILHMTSQAHEYGAAFVQEVYAHYEGLRDNTLLDRALLYYQATRLTHLFDSMAFGHIPLDEARKAFRTHVSAVDTMD